METRRWSRSLAYRSADQMLFGWALHPVRTDNGLVIGGGTVLPEVNFTLPAMAIRENSWESVRALFREMASTVLERLIRLDQEAVVLELEQLYEMTERPEWGATIVGDLREVIDQYQQKEGIRVALRVTVADIREQERPPRLRTGDRVDRVLEAFERSARAGADILSIESVGGKELYDQALIYGDIPAIVAALGILAPRDMEFLWGQIVRIARETRVIPGGDTDCGHANTAMQLAHQGMLPTVLAAWIRHLGAVRSLVACEMGAVGPLKDCGYENPVLKAITGVPISMEGKSSACAHSSPMGNIAAAVCDLWSNESVQHVRLLGGFAPEVFGEILLYDCRLMNAALEEGDAPTLQRWLVHSDRNRDPQAWALDPAVMFQTAQTIVEATPAHPGPETDYARLVAVARDTYQRLQAQIANREIPVAPAELPWLDRIGKTLDELPDDPTALLAQVQTLYPDHFLPEAYGLETSR